MNISRASLTKNNLSISAQISPPAIIKLSSYFFPLNTKFSPKAQIPSSAAHFLSHSIHLSMLHFISRIRLVEGREGTA
jgi:hypothetical protein